MSRELLARAWAAGAGPGDGPLTIDLDSTICETYGLFKEGARHHGYTGQRGYHPLLAIAAGTGDVLMARLREGRANTARGAAHFLPPTSCVKRWDECAMPGPADNSRCAPTAASTPMPWSPSAERWTSTSPSPSASTPACTISSRPYPRRTGRPSPCILTLAMEPGAADRHPLGHDRPSSSEGRRAPYMQSPNSCLGQSSPYRARTGQRSRRRYRWKENRDT